MPGMGVVRTPARGRITPRTSTLAIDSVASMAAFSQRCKIKRGEVKYVQPLAGGTVSDQK